MMIVDGDDDADADAEDEYDLGAVSLGRRLASLGAEGERRDWRDS